MPTVCVYPDDLYREIGDRYSLEGFDDLCFQFGLEFDGEDKDDDGNTTYRVEVPANRTDLLSVEGIGKALRVFLGKCAPPMYVLEPVVPNPQLKMVVKASTATIRPYGFAAILRGVQFTTSNYKSFIDLQDKLHHNIARRRQLVAIGTHDLHTLTGPFVYSAEDPKAINFIPLNQTATMDGHGMMETLSAHAQLKAYLPIIRDSPVYPVIRDSNQIVLSVPPIINGEHSKISLKTSDIFIEVTAKDRTRGSTVLNTVVAAFSKYCAKEFTIEPVSVEYEESHPLLGGKCFVNPDLSSNTFTTDMAYIRSLTGIADLTRERACELLSKMMIPTVPAPDSQTSIIATTPITRADVLHPCDLVEDVAIAYGFNNITSTTFSSVEEQPYMALSNQIRSELANCGYHEALNWGLCSVREGFELLQRKWRDVSTPSNLKPFEYDPLAAPVQLSNPKSREFEIVRTSLLPGLLKSLASNKAQELPLRLFEIGDVVCIDPSTETGARSSRYCAALIANNAGSGLEHIHGLLDVILAKLSLAPEYHEMQSTSQLGMGMPADTEQRIYKLVLSEDDGAFLPGRCVKIVVEPGNVQLGVMGVLHPSVLKGFNVSLPCSLFEFSIDPFLQWLSKTRLADE